MSEESNPRLEVDTDDLERELVRRRGAGIRVTGKMLGLAAVLVSLFSAFGGAAAWAVRKSDAVDRNTAAIEEMRHALGSLQLNAAATCLKVYNGDTTQCVVATGRKP